MGWVDEWIGLNKVMRIDDRLATQEGTADDEQTN